MRAIFLIVAVELLNLITFTSAFVISSIASNTAPFRSKTCRNMARTSGLEIREEGATPLRKLN